MFLQSRLPLTSLLATLLLAACTSATDPSERSGPLPAPSAGSQPRMAIVNYQPVDLSTPGAIAEYARAELLVSEASAFWSDRNNDGAVAALKAANPDLRVIGYLNAHASWLSWGDEPTRDAENNGYGWEWYQATRPYWSFTTTGDTMMSWPGKVLLNVLDPACRAAMIAVIADHWRAHDNVLDGVYWDHFNLFLWVPDVIPGVDGQMDLDGDGIAHREDEDEMAAYRDASVQLVTGLRDALGPDVIQIANGGRSAVDSTFAGLLDGMLYENFPEVGFWGERMRQAVDPATYNNLFAARHWPRSRNGGPWLILSNKDIFHFVDDKQLQVQYRSAEFARVVAALTGCLVSYHSDAQRMDYGWPRTELDLGAPRGGVTITGDTIAREFARGRVSLTMTNGSGTVPFRFEVHQGGALAQSFAYPSHYP